MQAAARVMGNDQTIAFCGAAGSQFQLNIMMPVMADTVLESVRILAGATRAFTRLCLCGMEANVATCEAEVERSPAHGHRAESRTSATSRRPSWPRRRWPPARPCGNSPAKSISFRTTSLEKALDPWRMIQPAGE